MYKCNDSMETSHDEIKTEFTGEELMVIQKTNKSVLVEYGPIRVRHRRSVSQTLATGRRSKEDPTFHEDPIKRDTRRTKNRLAARELKRTRDNIEMQLTEQIQALEQEREFLQNQHKQLESQKAKLTRELYNAKQAPFVPFIADLDISVLYGPEDRQDLLFDLRSVLNNFDD